jgi:hypothetical protein
LFDTHFHIIDFRFPVQENQGFMPPSFPVDSYLERTRRLGIDGGCVVSGSFQGFDTAFMLDALKKFGATFVGVIQMPASVSDEEIRRLDAAGVRGVRFNLVRGGSASIDDLDRLARRVFDLAGWRRTLRRRARSRSDLSDARGVAGDEHCAPGVVACGIANAPQARREGDEGEGDRLWQGARYRGACGAARPREGESRLPHVRHGSALAAGTPSVFSTRRVRARRGFSPRAL